MRLTFIAQNLKFGGFWDDHGQHQDRWPELLKRLNSSSTRPDFILLTEARDWEKQGHGQLARAMEDLDMDALPLAPSKSGQYAALLYRRETVGRWKHWNTAYTHEVTQSFGVAAFDVGLPALISVLPVHITPYGKEKALVEAALITSRAYRHGPLAIIGGDINYSPARGPEPDWAKMLPYHYSTRTIMTDDPNAPVKTDRRIGLTIERAGFVDVAWYMYEKTKKDKYIRNTGPEDRVDQFWVTKPLANGIVDYWLLDEPETATDHAGIGFTLDTDLVEAAPDWQYH